MTDSDTAAVLSVHQRWLAANVGLVTEAIVDYFPTGRHYLQFNLNGFTYNGVEDKVKLWRNLNAVGANILRIDDVGDPVIEVFGDVALLTSEGECEVELPSPSGGLESSGPMRFRNTEFYRRDDGSGSREWRIWHMHVSAAAPEGALKHVTE